jgi:hypothetical protein
MFELSRWPLIYLCMRGSDWFPSCGKHCATSVVQRHGSTLRLQKNTGNRSEGFNDIGNHKSDKQKNAGSLHWIDPRPRPFCPMHGGCVDWSDSRWAKKLSKMKLKSRAGESHSVFRRAEHSSVMYREYHTLVHSSVTLPFHVDITYTTFTFCLINEIWVQERFPPW